MAVVRIEDAPFSSSRSRCTYDVFLSFRGEDVRKSFMDHLYTAMVQARFRTFRDDDELKRGENIKLELEEAIQRSRVSIVVLSKEYAFSRWCLDELLMILHCRRRFGQLVLPVFYHVDPSEVRKQKGRFEEAFRKYEERLFNVEETDHEMKRERMDKVKRWREALRQVADLAGMDIQNQSNGHESNFIQKIVKVIADKLNHTALDLTCHPVGIHSRAESINLWVQDESASVNIYVIYGMGGIGKTTIAKYIYNLNSRGFGCKSFLANIRETSEQPNGLLGLQKQILSEILKLRKIKVYNVDEGTAMIKDAMSCEKVFLVLDDVNDVNQLDALLGTRKFYPGSKIIITTRDKWLLKAHEVHKVYAVEKLDDHESLELFTQHAFGQDHPLEGYVELSNRVVQHCGGLPLAHKVLGSSLSGKSVDVWESELKKLEAIPDAHILNILKVSYDSLQDDHDKNLFLHIACFFVGNAKDDTVKILDGCGFFTVVGIENLTDRCLITINKDNKLMMHQLIKEMGRDIVYRESPEEPEKRSRLWHHKDSFKVLKKRTGTKAIEGCIFDMRMVSMEKSGRSSSHVNNVNKRQLEEFASVTSSKRRYLSFISWLSVDNSSRHLNEADLKTDAFARMKKLKLLHLNYVKLSGDFGDFPRNLRWLSWHGFPLKSIPMELSLTKVVALDMSYSKLEQVWDGIKLLGSLKILNLSYSIRLSRTPDFSALPNVEKVILTGCVSLVEICESIVYLEGLTVLDLKDCKSLRKLPSIDNLKFLETLIISGCSSLGGFPTSPSNVKSLNADGFAITGGKVKSWHPFAWSWVSKPRKIPVMILPPLPRSLVSLSLAQCNLSNDSFPKDFSNLSSLRCLDLSGNPILSLPDCVRNISTLKNLYLNSCKSLKNVLGLPSVEDLRVGGCTPLQRITYKSASFLPSSLEHTGCLDLDEIQSVFKLEPIEEVDRELINSLGWFDVTTMGNLEVNLYNPCSSIKKRPIQGMYEFGIFNTFLPGREVPGWFSEKRTGSSISFTVPPLPDNLKIQGLNLCLVYAHSDKEEHWFPPPLYTKISNKTKDLDWVYGPLCFGIPEADEDLVWLSHWKFGSQLESGDLIDVKIVVGECFQVKECGIHLVYTKQEEEDRHKFMYLSWKDVISGDLSSFQLRTGAYFLCHKTGDQYLYIKGTPEGEMLKDYTDWTRGSWFQDLFGDSIKFEEVRHWGWYGRHTWCGRHSRLKYELQL